MDENKIVKVGVGVVILNPQKQILLGLRKSAHGNGSWCPPGGHLEYAESFEKTAVRETMEETGIALDEKNAKVLGVTNDFFEESGKHYITVVMGIDNCQQQPTLMEPDKCERWQWFELDKLPDNMFLPMVNFLKKYPIKTC